MSVTYEQLSEQIERLGESALTWQTRALKAEAAQTILGDALHCMLTEFAHNEHAECGCKSCLAIRKGLVAAHIVAVTPPDGK